MRKEQILLVGCAAVGALLIMSATGKYQEVDAASLGDSPTTAVPGLKGETPNPFEKLKSDPLKGRSLWAQTRLERRAPLPEIPLPVAMPLWWVPPLPYPGPTAEHWRPYRTTIVPAKAPEKEDKSSSTGSGATVAGADEKKPDEVIDIKKPDEVIDIANGGKPRAKFDKEKYAWLESPNGEKRLVEVEYKGKNEWDILADWPRVGFNVWYLNDGTGARFGEVTLSPAELQGYTTLHLRKTLENEYHEERIRRGVKDADRDALVRFAQWIFDDLSKHSGVDNVVYGLDAVKLAIEELKKAVALQSDIATTKLLGQYQRAAFDIEGELNTYLAFLKDHPTDSAVMVLVADTYERLGVLDASRALFEKAAQTGDPEARLRLGVAAEREGRLDAAAEILKPLAGLSVVGPKAATELAWIAMAQGRIDDAANSATQAQKGGPSPSLALAQGAILYAQRKFGEAALAFSSAKTDDKRSIWQSDRGMAMLGNGDFDGAKKEFNACLESDSLNLVDPLFGLGDALQHNAATVQASNDHFETARVRSPDDPWILLRVGTTRLRDGRFVEALDLGRHLLDLVAGCDEGLWLVGRSAESLARGEDAMKKASLQSMLDIASRAKTPDADEVTTLKDLLADATPEARRTDYFFNMSLAHLRRATEKEPDNREFIHDYARVLVLAGHVDDAIKVLEAATTVGTGIGRSDPRLFALLAWARFLGKRPTDFVQEVLQRGLRAQPDDETKKWLETVRKLVDDWEHTRVWEDLFNRPPSSDVGNGWKENDKVLGIAIALDAGRAIFKSERVKEAAATRDAATRLFRDDMELNRFKQMETSFKACQGVETIFHMSVGVLTDRGTDTKKSSRGAELGIGCDRNGNMVVWAPNGTKSGPVENVIKDAAGAPRPWPMDDFHKVRIVRKDDAKGIFEIWLDDERITLGTAEKPQLTFEVPSLSSAVGRNFALGFLVDADAGAQVDVEVESVQVTKTSK